MLQCIIHPARFSCSFEIILRQLRADCVEKLGFWARTAKTSEYLPADPPFHKRDFLNQRFREQHSKICR
jgi:hypothetical protein